MVLIYFFYHLKSPESLSGYSRRENLLLNDVLRGYRCAAFWGTEYGH